MPELEVVSWIFTSSSKTKSPYSLSVTKNVLGEFGTVNPTMAPSSILYSAVPVIFFHPARVLPSKRFVQPELLPWLCKTKYEKRKIIADMNRFFIIHFFNESGPKLREKRQVGQH